MLGFLPNLPNSKQLYHLNLNGGNCQLFPTCPELADLIDYYWLLSISAAALELEVIPDTATDLVLCPESKEFAALYFPTTEIQRIPLQGPITYTGICFRPTAINTLLASELSQLRALDMGANTIDYLGIEHLIANTLGNRDIQTLQNSFDRFWMGRLSQSKNTASTFSIAELVNVMQSSLGNESVASVCSTLNISERHFRRLSNELFGLSPKKIQRILRLQVALSELFQCEAQQLQDLYYDDSHRIRELKKLTGFTPHQIRTMAEKYNQA